MYMVEAEINQIQYYERKKKDKISSYQNEKLEESCQGNAENGFVQCLKYAMYLKYKSNKNAIFR